jgi:hypothetical protein
LFQPAEDALLKALALLDPVPLLFLLPADLFQVLLDFFFAPALGPQDHGPDQDQG